MSPHEGLNAAKELNIGIANSQITHGDFLTDLQRLINRHSVENASDTPDFILAQFVAGVVREFSLTVKQRDSWWGHKTWDKSPVPAPEGPVGTVRDGLIDVSNLQIVATGDIPGVAIPAERIIELADRLKEIRDHTAPRSRDLRVIVTATGFHTEDHQGQIESKQWKEH
jgi:hypothetical protein